MYVCLTRLTDDAVQHDLLVTPQGTSEVVDASLDGIARHTHHQPDPGYPQERASDQWDGHIDLWGQRPAVEGIISAKPDQCPHDDTYPNQKKQTANKGAAHMVKDSRTSG